MARTDPRFVVALPQQTHDCPLFHCYTLKILSERLRGRHASCATTIETLSCATRARAAYLPVHGIGDVKRSVRAAGRQRAHDAAPDDAHKAHRRHRRPLRCRAPLLSHTATARAPHTPLILKPRHPRGRALCPPRPGIHALVEPFPARASWYVAVVARVLARVRVLSAQHGGRRWVVCTGDEQLLRVRIRRCRKRKRGSNFTMDIGAVIAHG